MSLLACDAVLLGKWFPKMRAKRSFRNFGKQTQHMVQPRRSCEILISISVRFFLHRSPFVLLSSGIYDMIYLLTAIGQPPGGSSTVNIYIQTIQGTSRNKQYIEQHNNQEKNNTTRKEQHNNQEKNNTTTRKRTQLGKNNTTTRKEQHNNQEKTTQQLGKNNTTTRNDTVQTLSRFPTFHSNLQAPRVTDSTIRFSPLEDEGPHIPTRLHGIIRQQAAI